MARPRTFDRDEALDAAIGAFAEQGFDGTSTDALLEAMNISRQSLYDTFGDKRSLYTEALARYQDHSVDALIRTLNTANSPLKGLQLAVMQLAGHPPLDSPLGCFGVSAICEFGTGDAKVNALNAAAGARVLAALERRLIDARELEEVPESLDVKDTAQFLLATMTGLKVAARGGAPVKDLKAVATVALRCLSAVA